MVTLDRRKLVAPVFAQAAAFVVVLAIGGFTHHGGTVPTPGPTPGLTRSASPRASSTTPAATKGQAAKLTVTVLERGTPGLTVAGSAVQVLRNGTLTAVASGPLKAALEFAANVPAGAYQVCVKPPSGWTSAVKDTHAFHGFICLLTTVGSAPQAVTFQLTPPRTQAGA